MSSNKMFIKSQKMLPSVCFVAAGVPFLSLFSGCATSARSHEDKNVAIKSEIDTAVELRRKIFEKVRLSADDANLSIDVLSIENLGNYADYLIEITLKKGLSTQESELPITGLLLAFAQEKTGKSGKALMSYVDIIYLFPDSDFAAEALYQQGEIYSKRRQFSKAIDCFSALEDSFPASPRVDDAIVQAYLVTEMCRKGVRPLVGGWLPWFRDRSGALTFFDRLYEMAPHKAISPRLLYHKGKFAFELSDEWFSFDKKQDAIDAFERLISIYPDAKFVPEAYLELAGTYKLGIVGADWDQLSTRRAISYYTDFYSLFPEHQQAEFAYEQTIELTDLLAQNRLVFGDFYYSRHNNLRGAVTFYNEAITLAPNSRAGKDAQRQIARIRRGERAERTWVDWVFGRYPRYDAMDYLDSPSLRPLDEMGFRSGNRASDENLPLFDSDNKPQGPGEN